MRRLLLLLGLLALLMASPLVGTIARPAHNPATSRVASSISVPPAQDRVALRVASSISATDAGAPPAFDRDFPDPSIIAARRVYYAFATSTAWEPSGHMFPILESSDLASWRYAGDVFPAPPAWGTGD